jgi:transposase
MELFIGIDVGKFNLDTYIHPLNKALKIENNKAGYELLFKTLQSYTEQGYITKLAICEATGGYERPMVEFFMNNKLPIHIAHPNKVRNFAKAIGKFAKTDKIDAKILSEFAKVFTPEAKSNFTNKDLLELKAQIIDNITQEKNRLDKNLTDKAKKSINNHIQFLQKELKDIDQDIKELIKNSEELRQSIDLLTSIPGVGINTAAAIQTQLSEITSANIKQLSSLVGIAPMNNESGIIYKKRNITGGRKTLRCYLYMATIASLRVNHEIKTFYNKLISKGKATKVAIVACMHKLLNIIKIVTKRNTPWIQYN